MRFEDEEPRRRQGRPVSGAEVVVAGLGRSRTNRQGYAKFYLPRDDVYALVVRYANHEEVLSRRS